MPFGRHAKIQNITTKEAGKSGTKEAAWKDGTDEMKRTLTATHRGLLGLSSSGLGLVQVTFMLLLLSVVLNCHFLFTRILYFK